MCVVFLVVFAASIFISSAQLFAEGKVDRTKVNLLKWMGPGQPGTYEDYMNRRPKGKFRIDPIYPGVEDNTRAQKVLIIVNSSIYSSLETQVLRYADSLIACGYNAPVYQSSYGTAEDLKSFIISNQADLIGCVFVGELPTAWFEVANDFDMYGYASFPCDLFLMDLDGTWTDSDSDGLYDGHSDGSGDRQPEIFVGRMDLSQMGGNEIDNMTAFFNRDNDYWIGNITLLKYGLTYTEDDWASYDYFLHDISYLYGSNYEAIAAPATSESDYRTYRLGNISYEFIQLSCHSSPTLHAFTRGGYCYYYEVQAVPPQALGINMFCCSSNRFTTANYLGGAYLLHNGPKALSVIGSTKTGSMLDFDLFYTPLGQNKTMGTAFKEWFEAIAPYDMNDLYWHYGMSVVGDPMITFLSVCGGGDPPAAPTNLTASAVSCSRIDLAWQDNSGDETQFHIERSTDGSNFAEIDTVGAGVTSYNDTTAAAETTYWYRVRAYNSYGYSGYSNIDSAATPACQGAPPAAPTNLQGSNKAKRKITLTWTDNANDEDGFYVYRCTDGVNFQIIATLGANLSTYTDTSVSSGTYYYYKVCAYNSYGESCSNSIYIKAK